MSTDKINKFILDQGSSLYLPKIFNSKHSKKLKFYQFNEDDSLEQNKFGVLEPLGLGKSLKPKYLDLIIIPVRGINKNNKRLGYGGGYFDRLRADKRWRAIPCIGVLTSNCVSNHFLVREDWDIPLSGFITEKEILV